MRLSKGRRVLGEGGMAGELVYFTIGVADTERARAYFDTARRTAGALARRARDRSSLFPKIVVEES